MLAILEHEGEGVGALVTGSLRPLQIQAMNPCFQSNLKDPPHCMW